MATVRIATSSILKTVAETAAAAGNLVGAIGSGAAYINDFADNLRSNQLIDIKAGRVGYIDTVKAKHALVMLSSRRELDAYVDANPHHADALTNIMQRLDEALA